MQWLTRLTSIQRDVGSNPARGKLPIFSDQYVGKIKTHLFFLSKLKMIMQHYLAYDTIVCRWPYTVFNTFCLLHTKLSVTGGIGACSSTVGGGGRGGWWFLIRRIILPAAVSAILESIGVKCLRKLLTFLEPKALLTHRLAESLTSQSSFLRSTNSNQGS